MKLLSVTLTLLLFVPGAFGDTYTYPDGSVYEGQLNNGVPHGFGKLVHPKGETYEGQLNNGVPHGIGKAVYIEGSIYEGEYEAGNRHGFGKMARPDGRTYEGEWKAGNANGFGKAVYVDGSIYEGGYEAGVPHGFGKLVHVEGETYEGEYEAGKKSGFGKNVWPSGTTYEGEWKADKRSGFGKNVSPSGVTYEGEWKADNFVRNSSINLQPRLDAWQRQKQRWEQQRARHKVAMQRLERPRPSPEKQPEYNPRSYDSDELITAASGSGFFVSKEGHLVTNNHVINHCSEVKFKHAGAVMDATVIARDRVNDLALLKTGLKDPTTLPISSSNPALLQDIYAAGFPFGSSVSAAVKVTKGIVSSLSGVADNFSNVQIDAALQPGNSGGPIVDEYGNAVAVAVAKLDLEQIIEEFGVVPENTNFGIKATVVRNLLEGSGIQLTRPNTTKLSGAQLGQRITESTVHLSCLMTMAQIEQVRDQKVLFTEFD